MSAALRRTLTLATRAPATAARVHAERLRLARATCAIAVPSDGPRRLLRAAGWVGALVMSIVLAAWCVAPIWILPSALSLTAGMLLISGGLGLAQRLQLRSLWWRACWRLRRLVSADNLCRLLFAAGTLWSVWNLGGFDRLLARWPG